MSDIKRIYVEKRKGFDIEAQNMLFDLRNNLGMKMITNLRILNRYDIAGISDEDYNKAKHAILSETNQDIAYDEQAPFGENEIAFAMEYLPGQYDQRADSTEQCLQFLSEGEKPKAVTARVIALSGDIEDSDLNKIKAYLINPVESRIAKMDKPESLDMELTQPEKIKTLEGFTDWTLEEIENYHREMGLAMTTEDLDFVRKYFKDDEKRDPTVTEIRVIDTYWSDHCRHTTFLTELEEIEIESGPLSDAIEESLKKYLQIRADLYSAKKKDISLMDMATIGAKALKEQGMLDDLDESEEINACSIKAKIEIDGKQEDWIIQFKNETHNHPTEIEPFGGAATCLGGAIRDPLSGRAYVYQAMRITGSGDPRTPFEETLPGKLPQSKITVGAANGYSSYGNQIGLATGQVVELYDEGYVAKRLEIGAVVGASPASSVVRLRPEPGDVIILLGGRTGRDGCGGATGSSKAHDSTSIESCGAEVQKGNPPTERKLQRLFRNPKAATMIKRCNDFGAGGVCVAIGELADGLEIDLDKAPKKYEGLDGTELAISESQERMAVVLDPAKAQDFIKLADEENLEAVPVAVVSQELRLKMTWKDDLIVDISRDFLNTNGVTGKARCKIVSAQPEKDYRYLVPDELEEAPLFKALQANLSRLEVCSQKGLSERFDSSIGAATVLMPFGGKYQLTPEEAMCAKIPLLQGETDDATAMSYGFIPRLSMWSPYHGAIYAVIESLAKLAAIGADPFKARLTFQEYFERLRQEPERWGKPAAALLGALTAQLEMGTPSIGGKDSMSGSFNDLDVPPTLVSFAITMTKASQIASSTFKSGDSSVYFLPLPVDSSRKTPDWDKTKNLFNAVYQGIKSQKILSASVVKEGGAAACVCKMAFGDKFGFTFENDIDRTTLFAPQAGSFVIETNDDEILESLDSVKLGTVNEEGYFYTQDGKIETDELISSWLEILEDIFPNKSEFEPEMKPDIPHYIRRNDMTQAINIGRPRIFIPTFPGTNCEIDTFRAFEKAGGDPRIMIIKNRNSADIEESIEKMSNMIKNSQIIMIPGGFSAGDEPDGSGKFIATAFRNARAQEAIRDLLNNRDGLILGICNGFQALIKLGLLPYGEIRDIKESDPTLTFNSIGRHVSRMAYTRVTSVMSPWLSNANAGDLFAVPVSHGEGRFVANSKTLDVLAKNGQIATQYVSPDGSPSESIEWNPNGSVCAVEGITSPDGRIFGKMGHSERKGDNLYKNVPGNKDQLIFESGVNYFKI